jgi:hypothetical protein
MMYKANSLSVLRYLKNSQRKANIMYNYIILNLVVRVKRPLGFTGLR